MRKRCDQAILSGFSFQHGRLFNCRDLRHCLPHDAVKIAHHADRRLDHGAGLGLSLGPGLHHELAFLVDIFSHVFEALDDGFDSLLEPRTGEVLIDLISLGLLTSLRCACAGDLLVNFEHHGGPFEIKDAEVVLLVRVVGVVEVVVYGDGANQALERVGS